MQAVGGRTETSRSDRHPLRARNAVGPTTSMMRTLEYTDMSESGMDIETIAKLGGYENEDAVIDEAVRELFRQRPAFVSPLQSKNTAHRMSVSIVQPNSRVSLPNNSKTNYTAGQKFVKIFDSSGVEIRSRFFVRQYSRAWHWTKGGPSSTRQREKLIQVE